MWLSLEKLRLSEEAVTSRDATVTRLQGAIQAASSVADDAQAKLDTLAAYCSRLKAELHLQVGPQQALRSTLSLEWDSQEG